MALPINTTPTYNLVVPSTDETVKYRPFFVKEEKALLIAQQSEDANVMVDTLKGVIKSCVLSEINVDNLATFDIEYIFSQIRAKSVGEIVELIFSCDEDHGEKNEDAKVKVSFDLTKIKIDKDPSHNNKIELFDDVGVCMKYPDINTVKKIQDTDGTDVDKIFETIIECIDYIYDSNEVFSAKDQSKKELLSFLENLTSEQFAKIQKFFETMPRIRQEVTYTCPVCGKQYTKYLEGINSFF